MYRSPLMLIFTFYFCIQYCNGQIIYRRNANPIDSFTILISGMTPPRVFEDAEKIVAAKWKIKVLRVGGCLTTKKFQDSVNNFNKISLRNIEKKYGSRWRNQFDKEVDAEAKILQNIERIVDGLDFVKKKSIEIESRKGFLSYGINKLQNKNEYFVSVEGLDNVKGKSEWFLYYQLLVNASTRKYKIVSDLKLSLDIKTPVKRFWGDTILEATMQY